MVLPGWAAGYPGFLQLVSAGAGGAGTGDPFVKVKA